MSATLINRDLQHIWHPCAQMKDYETFKPLIVRKAYGSYLELADGRQIIDATSSWWCKSLGHNHPRLKQALLKQTEQFEHVISANTTQEILVVLAEKLAALTQHLDKIMFASDGSCAIEIALKMSLQARQIMGQPQRQRFMALSNGYHGETCAALSVSDLGLYRNAYQPLLFDTEFIRDTPYVSGRQDPLWHDCSAQWPAIEQQLNQQAEQLTAIIVEPIVQGAGGMRIYSQDFLRRLRQWTRKQGIHLIADEIMTGFGRTGLALACQHSAIEPDFLCLGKGLTSGWLPLSAVLTSSAIYQLFYADYDQNKAFLHSHTYSGNALAASIAVECLTLMAEENIYARVQQREPLLQQLMTDVAAKTGKLQNIRGIGAVVAADLITDNPKQRLGHAVFQQATRLGALLRPLDNTLYWLPPLNTEDRTLYELRDITCAAILAAI